MNICIFGASSALIDRKYLDVSHEMGRAIALHGHTLYFGGGDTGVMGAAARGTSSAGGKTVSVVPSFFDVDGVLYPHTDRTVYTETMGERKQYLESHSDAFIAMPGGIGTYDEFFECITNKQLGIHNKPVAVFNVFHYYDIVKELIEHTIEERFMKTQCRSLCVFLDNTDDILKYIEEYVPSHNPDSFFKDR